jgi:hypothetical protein
VWFIVYNNNCECFESLSDAQQFADLQENKGCEISLYYGSPFPKCRSAAKDIICTVTRHAHITRDMVRDLRTNWHTQERIGKLFQS